MKKITLLFILVFRFVVLGQVQKIQYIQITGGTPGLNKVLISDSNGNASWQSLEIIGLTPAFGAVQSSTGKIWMDRNLGATRSATSVNDYLAYGNLYQWGRSSDGHEKINWTNATSGTPANGITTTLSNTNSPSNSLFIVNNTYPNDWRNPNNDNLWQGVDGINNPCPSGYRLPTETEFNAEINANNITKISILNTTNSPFRFVFPSMRYGITITILGTQYLGYIDPNNLSHEAFYWTSTVKGFFSRCCYINDVGAGIISSERTAGYSIRCIKD